MEKLFLLVLLRQTYVNSLSLCDTGDGVLEFDETKTFTTFRCADIPAQHTFQWTVFYEQTFNLGYCPPPSSGQSTCVPVSLKTTFQISRTSATESFVSGNNVSSIADKGTLTCRDMNTTQPGTTCPFDYVYPAEGAACSAEFSSLTWSLAAQCTVTKIRSVRRRYKCQLLQVNQVTGETLLLPNVQMSTTPTGNSGYMSGVCNMSNYLPSDGQYIFTVTIFPGNINVTAVFTGDNKIRRPTSLPSNDCPMYVKENDTLDCRCFANDSGIPEGLLQWNVTGSKQLLLPRVQRTQNGMMSVCRLAWNNTVLKSPYTLIVAYPPTQLSFKFIDRGGETLNVTENTSVTMVCQSDGRPTPHMTISKMTGNGDLATLPAGNITSAEITVELNHTITTAQCVDSDLYRCTADNNMERKEQLIKLAVMCKPRREPIDDTYTPSVTFEGQQVQITFQLIAYPTPVITSKTWLGLSLNDSMNGKPANDSVIHAECSSSSVKIYATNCIITINSVTSDTAGFYRVNVTNGFGSLLLTFAVVLGNFTDNTSPIVRPESEKSVVGAIVGGVVGGLVAICLITIIAIFLVRRKGEKDNHKYTSRTSETPAQGSKGAVLSMSPATESDYENQNFQGDTAKKGKTKGKGAQEAKRRNKENLVYTTVVFSNDSTGSSPALEAESTEYATIVGQTSGDK